MKITDTISVNPSKTTLGHVETPSSAIFRSPVLGAESTSHAVDFIKVLFPSCASGNQELRKYEVPLRTLFATILIISGITLLEANATVALAVCSLCFGALLALGLFTRPVMLGAALYYAIAGALSIRTGHCDISCFMLMFGCVVFAIAGGGKYSLDTLMRKAIMKFKINRINKQKADYLGYKAFHKVKF